MHAFPDSIREPLPSIFPFTSLVCHSPPLTPPHPLASPSPGFGSFPFPLYLPGFYNPPLPSSLAIHPYLSPPPLSPSDGLPLTPPSSLFCFWRSDPLQYGTAAGSEESGGGSDLGDALREGRAPAEVWG
uniref:Uncharacterized protein n=1 Tax=Tetraselmis sp. GSL018 TaxID=582737 RepID=A0A061QQZ3_9CHLO